jgi:glycosyltransferase involved in cell wall biosynthesis
MNRFVSPVSYDAGVDPGEQERALAPDAQGGRGAQREDTPSTTTSMSVVVCAHTMDRFDQTCRCVSSVLTGTLKPDEIIVVVDRNPTLRDRLRETLANEVQVIENAGSGAADARTTALHAATGAVALFIDDDAWAEPDWLSELHHAFQDPDVIGTGGRVVPEWEDPRLALPEELYWIVGSTYRGHRTDAGPISRPIGANMAARREALIELGGFPSAFGPRAGTKVSSNEELATFTAMTNHFGDRSVQYVPSAVVHHFAPAARCTPRYVLQRSFVEGTSKADVRLLFGSAVMGADRTYVREVLGSGVLGYLTAAARKRELRPLRYAGLVVASFLVTAFAYAMRLGKATATKVSKNTAETTETIVPGSATAGPNERPKSSGPLRVAMVTARSVPFMGGIETHVDEVAGRLAKRGIEVTVLSTDVTGELPPFEVRDGVTTRRFPAYPKSKDYYVSPGLARALASGAFDVVHVQGVHNAVPPLALAVAERHKIPSLITFHTGGNSSPFRNAIRGIQWKVEGPLLRRATRLVAVCEFEADLFARALKVDRSEIALVRNGSERLPLSARKPDFAGAPLILSIGRLERYKGHHRAIAAMPAVLEHAADARLVIVGGGPYEAALREQVDRLSLDSSVSFASYGPADRDLMGALVRSADVAVLLSEYEAHPVAVMEALAEGVDVVVSATSGMIELGRDGLVTTVDLETSSEELARVLLEAARSNRWSAGAPTLQSWDDCADALAALYREVAN